MAKASKKRLNLIHSHISQNIFIALALYADASNRAGEMFSL